MELARHSTVFPALEKYSHASWESMTEALGQLPDLTPVEPEAMRATGTDGQNSVAFCVA